MEDKKDLVTEPKGMLMARLTRENRELGAKLNIAYAFIDTLRAGYDALLNFGINYQSLPEYKQDSPLDDLGKKPLEEVKVTSIAWLARVKSGIEAAIRRKNFRIH